MTPARGTVLVRKLELEQTVPGGKIFLPEAVRESMTPNQVEVVAVGDGSLCRDDDCERPHDDTHFYDDRIMRWRRRITRRHFTDIPVGSWAILAPRSLVATDQDGLFSARQDAVLAIVKP